MEKDSTNKNNDRQHTIDLLPGFNCGICGYARCDEFAGALFRNRAKLEQCHFLYQELFQENLDQLEEILREAKIIPKEKKKMPIKTARVEVSALKSAVPWVATAPMVTAEIRPVAVSGPTTN